MQIGRVHISYKGTKGKFEVTYFWITSLVLNNAKIKSNQINGEREKEKNKPI